MKSVLLLFAAAAAPLLAADGAMSATERAFLLDQLESSKKEFLASIKGLTPAQWTFKPSPTAWSVQECAEHIILAEEFIGNGVQQVLKTPAVERPANSNAEVDKKLAVGIRDRSRKATAPEPIVPSGKFDTPADAAKEFSARRAKTIEYVSSTNDELRTHVGPGPVGPMDGYQGLILLAAHSSRHTAQILEVKSNPNFPKSASAE
jgi:hypothetical protein